MDSANVRAPSGLAHASAGHARSPTPINGGMPNRLRGPIAAPAYCCAAAPLRRSACIAARAGIQGPGLLKRPPNGATHTIRASRTDLFATQIGDAFAPSRVRADRKNVPASQ